MKNRILISHLPLEVVENVDVTRNGPCHVSHPKQPEPIKTFQHINFSRRNHGLGVRESYGNLIHDIGEPPVTPIESRLYDG